MSGKPATHNNSNQAPLFGVPDAVAIVEGEGGLERLDQVLESLPEGGITEEVARYILDVVGQNYEHIRFTEVTEEIIQNYKILLYLEDLPFVDDAALMMISDLLGLLNQVEDAQEALKLAVDIRAERPNDLGLDLDDMIRRRRMRLKVRTEFLNGDGMRALRLYNALPADVRSEDPSLCRLVGEDMAMQGYRLASMHKDPTRLYAAAANAFSSYFQMGGRSPKAYECLCVVLTQSQRYVEAIDCIEAGIRASLDLGDLPNATNFALNCLQIEYSNAFHGHAGKVFSMEDHAFKRYAWMHEQYARGIEGQKAILLATAPLQIESLTMLEQNLVAKSAIELKDVSRALAIGEAMGDDEDGNVLRLLLLAKCANAQQDFKKARDLSLKALQFMLDAEADETSTDVACMMIYDNLNVWMNHTGEVETLTQFIERIPEEWPNRRKLLRLVVAASIAKCPKGEASAIAEATMAVLEPIPKKDRDAQWYVALGHARMQIQQYDKAISAYENAKKKISKLGKFDFSVFGNRTVAEMKAQLRETIESNIEVAKQHLTVQDKIPAVQARLKTLLEAAGLKIIRFINNGDGPVIAVCTHEVDGHIARIVVADEKTLMNEMPVPAVELGPETAELKQQLCSIAIPTDEAPFINRNDWRVQTLDIVGRKIRAVDQRLNTGFSIQFTEELRLPFTEYTGFVIIDPWDAAGTGIKKVELFEVVPLYKEEFEYACLYTFEQLFNRLQQTDFWPMKTSRDNSCLSSDWLPLIPKEQIRPLVKPPLGLMHARVSRQVLQHGADIGIFFRKAPFEGFSGWVFLAADHDPDDIERISATATVDLNTIANYAPYVVSFLDSEPGSAFIHEGMGSVKRTDFGSFKYNAYADANKRRLS